MNWIQGRWRRNFPLNEEIIFLNKIVDDCPKCLTMFDVMTWGTMISATEIRIEP